MLRSTHAYLVVPSDGISPSLQAFLGGMERVVLGQPPAIARAIMDATGGGLAPANWSMFELFTDVDDRQESGRLQRQAVEIEEMVLAEGLCVLDLGLKLMSLSEAFAIAESLKLRLELTATFRPQHDDDDTKV